MIDLRETTRIKNALSSQPGKYEEIIEDTDLAICITNENRQFVAVNQNYLNLYGYKRKDLIGNEFTIVVPEESREALKTYHDRFFVDKYEILRKWIVKNANGQEMEIFADAGYNDKIKGKPHKITLIQFQKIHEGKLENSSFGNHQVK